ncbi:MAG: hypothetical protein CL458_03800 [Acidimicrobiaceae bacterium]|jgi:hypothetical protein|nr:hypothetical protein [Acidimicrobiaceae bacterium]|tara:strand:- start:1456 stop:1791 length:336 start_codon:yes stop_codon:yes gene_type:complete
MSQDSQVSFEAIDNSESGDGGVEHGALLSRLCEAMFEEDKDQLASVKDKLLDAAGVDVLIDAVAVSANFYMMTRIADSTGTPLDAGTVEPSAEIRELVGVNSFTSRREAQK